MARIATVLDVSLPESWTQVLWSATNCRHCANTTVVSILKVVLRLSKVNDLDFVRLWQQEQVGRFQVSMADTDTLQIAKRRDDADNHLLELVLLPESARTFALAEQVLQVGATVHVLAHHGDAIRVVHRLIEVVAKELQHVRMGLYFKQLDGFFLYVQIQTELGSIALDLER